MIAWLAVLFFLAGSLGAFAAADRCRRMLSPDQPQTSSRPNVAQLLQSRSLLVALLAGCGLLSPCAAACYCDEFCQILPLTLQQMAEPLVWLLSVPMFAAFAGWLTYFAIRTHDPQSGFLLRSMTLMGVLLLLTGFRANAGVSHLLWQRVTPDGIVLQTSHFSCVAATVANMAGLCGQAISEKEAAELMRTTRSGTSMAGIRSGLTKLGIPHQTLPRSQNLISRIDFPALLLVDHPTAGYESHALLYRQPQGDRFELWEPMDGRLLMTEAQIATFWHGRGVTCVSLSSPD